MKQTSFLESVPTQQHFAAPVRRSDPATSRAAAAQVNVPGSWVKVAKILDQLCAASSYEVEVYARTHAIPISPSRIRGSLAESEMLGRGYVAISTVESKSEYGNDAQVYRLTEAGKQLARKE